MKTKLEIGIEALENAKVDQLRLEINESYLSRKSIVDKRFLAELGKIQADLKEHKEWINFLEEKIKEKFK